MVTIGRLCIYFVLTGDDTSCGMCSIVIIQEVFDFELGSPPPISRQDTNLLEKSVLNGHKLTIPDTFGVPFRTSWRR
uniref:Uncharacterized protein n=1 Tax=Caenorhabditis japonica TaxID=281687 RepID=A0A8R1E7Z7_CAEJA